MTELNAAAASGIVARAKAILLKPNEEWPVIAAEPDDTAGLFTGYAVPLAAIGPVCAFLHGQLFGYGMFGISWRPSLISGLAGMVSSYVVALVGLFVMAMIVDWLAPKFEGSPNRAAALKLVVYGATAGFLAGFAQLLPGLGILGVLGLYSFYLFYTGAAPLMKVPQEKAVAFTAVSFLCAVVLALVVSAVTRPVMGLFGGGAPALSDSGEVSGKLSVPGVGSIDVDKMKQASEQMEQASKKPPIAAAELQALLPASIGSYQRTAVESTGVNGMGSSADGTYTSGDNSFHLKVSDIAALGALAGVTSALGVEQSRQDADSYEKTGTVDGHMQTESWNTSSHSGKFGRMFGNRVMVEAEGSAASIDELKAAVASLDAGKLASLGS
jgi:hypothetical protein